MASGKIFRFTRLVDGKKTFVTDIKVHDWHAGYIVQNDYILIKPSPSISLLRDFVSGLFVRVVFAPIEQLKLFQQINQRSATSSFLSHWNGALWAGLRYVPSQAITLSLYSGLRNHEASFPKFARRFTLSAIASLTGLTLTHWMGNIAVARMLGFKINADTLLTGLGISFVGSLAYKSSYFTLNNLFTTLSGSAPHLASTVAISVISCVATMPLDVIRTVQLRNALLAQSTDFVTVSKSIWAQGGIAPFFTGTYAASARVVLAILSVSLAEKLWERSLRVNFVRVAE